MLWSIAVGGTIRSAVTYSKMPTSSSRAILHFLVVAGMRGSTRFHHRLVGKARRVASKLKGESIFPLGCAAPVSEMVDDHEARDGSLKHQEGQQS